MTLKIQKKKKKKKKKEKHISHSFCPISTKLCYKYVSHGSVQTISFLGGLPNLNKNYGSFDIFVDAGLYGAQNFKTLLLYSFIRSQPNFVMTLVITFLGNRPMSNNFGGKF